MGERRRACCTDAEGGTSAQRPEQELQWAGRRHAWNARKPCVHVCHHRVRVLTCVTTTLTFCLGVLSPCRTTASTHRSSSPGRPPPPATAAAVAAAAAAAAASPGELPPAGGGGRMAGGGASSELVRSGPPCVMGVGRTVSSCVCLKVRWRARSSYPSASQTSFEVTVSAPHC